MYHLVQNKSIFHHANDYNIDARNDNSEKYIMHRAKKIGQGELLSQPFTIPNVSTCSVISCCPFMTELGLVISEVKAERTAEARDDGPATVA